ncbi:CAMK family protein kinase [Histomonas meleagridis]|uniref:CAMK family protein kinase n=1 Tax=Histomonas meleagridis TaxID=135588 RepID=UPI00355A5612|nr:CAMK family protein kinase [Histomonas meleagridis]KAH0798675.1 CAMK family protein kinase [Histomonas meleagridis]
MNERTHEVGGYILGRTLGSGTTGKVKLAINKETNKQVAVKIIRKASFDIKPDLERKIHREVALMRLLNHPHLLKLVEVCESPHHLYIFIEYAPHGELFDYLVKRRFLNPPEAMMFFREIIYGLDYLHKHGICHRDLKPENILLDEFDHVKIADFGFARWMRSNIAETSCGSPHYAAPEVIRGEPYDGRGADVWSCGVILYALLAGRLPFDDDSIRNLLAKVKLGHYKMPNFLPEIQDLISQMLTVDVNHRIKIDQIKTHPAFLMDLPSTYTVPTPLPIISMSEPIDSSLIDKTIINILRCIGYNSDEEAMKELLCSGHTSAKVFYQMYKRNESLDSLPWSDDEDVPADYGIQPESGVFLMSPRQFGPLHATSDQFHRRTQVGSIGSFQSPQSLAQRPNWAGDFSPYTAVNYEQRLTDIELRPEELMDLFQNLLNRLHFRWFHPDDLCLIARQLVPDLLVTITASFEAMNMLQVVVSLVHGEIDTFDLLITEMGKAIDERLQIIRQ